MAFVALRAQSIGIGQAGSSPEPGRGVRLPMRYAWHCVRRDHTVVASVCCPCAQILALGGGLSPSLLSTNSGKAPSIGKPRLCWAVQSSETAPLHG